MGMARNMPKPPPRRQDGDRGSKAIGVIAMRAPASFEPAVPTRWGADDTARRNGGLKREISDQLRFLAVLLLLPYVGWLIFAYRYHFLDGVNLLVHEAGHVVFAVFGDTPDLLGGTLLQLLVPAVFVGSFLRRRMTFEGAVCGVWLAESLMYTARYLADAQAQALPLVGGHIHDWHWLLSHAGLLAHCEAIGNLLHVVASMAAGAALVWAARRAFLPDACASSVSRPPVRETSAF